MSANSFPTYAERPDKGTTIQNPSVALLCVDSYDLYQTTSLLGQRKLNTTPYNSIIYKKQALAAGAISRIALTECNFNWAIPTINDKNNKMSVTQVVSDGVGFDQQIIDITLDNGWYNFTDLATAIQNFLNANLGILTGTYAVSVDPVTFFMTIEYTVGAGPLETAGALPPYIQDPTELSTMLGFTGDDNADLPTNLSLTTASITGNFPRLTYTPYIDIVSQRLTKNQHIYDNSTSETSPIRSLLARIYLSREGIDVRIDEDEVVGARPFTIKEMYNFPKQIAWEPTENIDSIDLLVLDWRGNQLYSQPVVESSTGAPATDIKRFVGNAATFQLTIQLSEN